MRVTLKILLCWILMSGTLYASDIETEEFLPSAPMFSYALLEVRADASVRDNPREALSIELRNVPNVVWQHCIISKLRPKEVLRFRSSCVYFQQMVESTPDFKTLITRGCLLRLDSLMCRRHGSTLLSYVQNWGDLLQAMDKYAHLGHELNLYKYHYEFERLWRYRYVPGIDTKIILKGCELSEASMSPDMQVDLASRQMGFYFRYYWLRQTIRLLVPCVGILSGGWMTFFSSKNPMIHISESPWVELLAPAYRWDAYTFADSGPYYGLNRLPEIIGQSGDIAPTIMATCNNLTMIHLPLNYLTPYFTGIYYSSLPYYVTLAASCSILAVTNIVTAASHPGSDVNRLSNGQADQYYKSALGLSRYDIWGRRVWMGVKGVVAAGVVSAVVMNAVGYSHFVANFASSYDSAYNEAVQTTLQQYVDYYISYGTFLQKEFYGSAADPARMHDECFTYFLPEVFKNNTDVFVENHLMLNVSNAYQYKNGKLLYPYLYAYCRRMFSVLKSYNILNEETVVQAFFPRYAHAVVSRLQATPALIFSGSLFPALLPQVILAVHIFYLMFVAVY